MQLRERAGRSSPAIVAPIAEPIARKSERHLGVAQHAFVNAGPGHDAAWARAESEELLGTGAEISQVFAVIGCAGAKRQNCQAIGAGTGFRLGIAGIDGAQPIERRQFAADAGNGSQIGVGSPVRLLRRRQSQRSARSCRPTCRPPLAGQSPAIRTQDRYAPVARGDAAPLRGSPPAARRTARRQR